MTTINTTAQAKAEDAAESAVRKVLDVVNAYLPPDGISKDVALNRIIGIVDPWPLQGAISKEPKP